MYEGRHGTFDYTIERRLAADGHHVWRWQVTREGEPIASGVSPRSHDHAETAVLTFIFQIEADERCGRGAFAPGILKVG
jgi:predicted secreted protein